MEAASYTLAILLFVYIVGRLSWVAHMTIKYNRYIHEPWAFALVVGDNPACDKYFMAAMRFLKDYKHGWRTFHPLHWIDTWNKDYLKP